MATAVEHPVSEKSWPEAGADAPTARPAAPQLVVPGSTVNESFVKVAFVVDVVVDAVVLVVLAVVPVVLAVVPVVLVVLAVVPVVLAVVPVVLVVLVVLAVVPVVVLVVTSMVVVVVPPGQMQPGWHSSIAPPGELGGQLRLPGGSHCSPGSRNPLPQLDTIVVLVVVETGVLVVVLLAEVAEVVVVGGEVVVVATPQVTSPRRHAARTPDRHCPRCGLPGGPHVASICGRQAFALQLSPVSSSPWLSADFVAADAEHVDDEQASQQLD